MKKGLPKLTEEQFQQQVINFARLYGWMVAHFRKVRVQRKNGSVYYETPVAADGAGFPDLVMLRRGELVAAELKVGRNSTSVEQDRWLERFAAAGAKTFVWYPRHWPQIEETLA